MANASAVTLRELATASASGSGDAVDLGATRSALTLSVVVSALTGNVEPKLETSPDGSSGWRVAATFGRIDEAKRINRAFADLERYVRITWTLSSGGSVTFSANGEAHTTYAGRSDLLCTDDVIKRAERKDVDAVARALILASSTAESEMVTAVELAMTKWPGVLRMHVASMAAYHLGMRGGFQGAGIDEFLVHAHNEALSWLKRVGKREAHLAGVEPGHHPQVRTSSGNANAPDCYPPKFSDDWGDF